LPRQTEQKHLNEHNINKSNGEACTIAFTSVSRPLCHPLRLLSAGIRSQLKGIGKSESTPIILEISSFKTHFAHLTGQTAMEPDQRKGIRTLLKDLLLNDEGIQGLVRDIRVSSHDPYKVFSDIIMHNKQAQDTIGQCITPYLID